MVTQDTAHERAMAAVAGALDLVRYFGRWGRRPAQHVLGNAGRFTYLLIDLARGLTAWRVYLPRMFTQATHIGYGSLFIVLLVAGFAGAVTGLQTGDQVTGTLPLYYAGAVISEAMILELGPGLPALIPAGRGRARPAPGPGAQRVPQPVDTPESPGRSPL